MKKMTRVLAALLLAVLTLTCFAGCEQAPEDVLVDNFEKLKNPDEIENLDILNGMFDQAGIEDPDKLIDALFGNFDYDLDATVYEGEDKATIKASLTNTDMSKVITAFMTKIMSMATDPSIAEKSAEEIAQLSVETLIDCMLEEESTVTMEVTVTLTKVDGNWEVKTDTTLMNAMLGGLYDAAASLGMTGSM